jgi:O-antigen/teichoic acid export membrane protein
MEPISLSLRTRFGADFIWNLGSLAVLGVSGIVVNLLIARWGGSSDLGVFNQVFAFFIFLSQICVGGVHFSVLKEISDSSRERPELSDIASAGVVLAFSLASLVVLCCMPWTASVGELLQSPAVAQGLGLALPGIVFFSVNKVLLNILNGLRHMRAHAVFQALRYLLLVSAIAGVFIFDLDRTWLSGTLTFTEIVLLSFLAPYVHFRSIPLISRVGGRWRRLSSWARAHLWFGTRGMFSGVFTELNTRVDVLVLGFFFDDAKVGIYSFAAVFAEGFAQIPLVLRRNLDPLFGASIAQGKLCEIRPLVQRTRKLFFPLMLGLGAVSTLVYAAILPLLVADPSYGESVWVYGILAGAISVSAWFRPFGGLLLQGGFPGTYTVMTLAALAVNGMLALLLAPALGLVGCALAAAASFAAEALLLVVLTRLRMSVRV